MPNAIIHKRKVVILANSQNVSEAYNRQLADLDTGVKRLQEYGRDVEASRDTLGPLFPETSTLSTRQTYELQLLELEKLPQGMSAQQMVDLINSADQSGKFDEELVTKAKESMAGARADASQARVDEIRQASGGTDPRDVVAERIALNDWRIGGNRDGYSLVKDGDNVALVHTTRDAYLYIPINVTADEKDPSKVTISVNQQDARWEVKPGAKPDAYGRVPVADITPHLNEKILDKILDGVLPHASVARGRMLADLAKFRPSSVPHETIVSIAKEIPELRASRAEANKFAADALRTAAKEVGGDAQYVTQRMLERLRLEDDSFKELLSREGPPHVNDSEVFEGLRKNIPS